MSSSQDKKIEDTRPPEQKLADTFVDMATFMRDIRSREVEQVKTGATSLLSEALVLSCKAIVKQMARTEQLEQTIAFFASVIKSGEPWTTTCEKHMNEAFPKTEEPEKGQDNAD